MRSGPLGHHKGYRCLHPSGIMYVLRDAVFHEHVFPYSTLFTKPSSHVPSIPAIALTIPSVVSAPIESPSPSTTLIHSSGSPSLCVPSVNFSLRVQSTSQANQVPSLDSTPHLCLILHISLALTHFQTSI